MRTCIKNNVFELLSNMLDSACNEIKIFTKYHITLKHFAIKLVSMWTNNNLEDNY